MVVDGIEFYVEKKMFRVENALPRKLTCGFSKMTLFIPITSIYDRVAGATWAITHKRLE